MSDHSPASIADERATANTLPSGNARNSPEVAAHIARQGEIKNLFKGDLADEHLSVVPRVVSDKVFDMAWESGFDMEWESGRGSGYFRVESDYQDLADLVLLSVQAAHA